MSDFDIHTFIAKIYSKCPFLGFVYSSLEKVLDENIPTIAITMDNQLRYNSNFLKSLDDFVPKKLIIGLKNDIFIN